MGRTFLFIVISFFLNIILLSGCTYQNEEDLIGKDLPACDTTSVTYTEHVLPILQSRCYVCHDKSQQLGNVNLEGYTQVKTYIANGKLLGTIMHAPGFSPMPKGGAKLPDCDISKIKAWINAGASEN